MVPAKHYSSVKSGGQFYVYIGQCIFFCFFQIGFFRVTAYMFHVYTMGNTSESAINTELVDKMTRKKTITHLNQKVTLGIQ